MEVGAGTQAEVEAPMAVVAVSTVVAAEDSVAARQFAAGHFVMADSAGTMAFEVVSAADSAATTVGPITTHGFTPDTMIPTLGTQAMSTRITTATEMRDMLMPPRRRNRP